MPKRKLSLADVQNAHYLKAISSWKSGDKQQFLSDLFELVNSCAAKYVNSGDGGTIEPKCTGNDVSQEVYLQLIRWLYVGKGSRREPQSAYQLLQPSQIRRLARNIGFSGYKYPVQVGSLEDYSPIAWDLIEEETEDNRVSVFQILWESESHRLSDDFLSALRAFC